MSISGEQTDFDTKIADGCTGREWLNSFATGKPYEFGLHKRGRDYHVSLVGWDGEGKKRQYETKSLSSLWLPGKELAFGVGTTDKGQVQVTIDSFEITRVSE